jgi:hypothetical protein
VYLDLDLDLHLQTIGGKTNERLSQYDLRLTRRRLSPCTRPTPTIQTTSTMSWRRTLH